MYSITFVLFYTGVYTVKFYSTVTLPLDAFLNTALEKTPRLLYESGTWGANAVVKPVKFNSVVSIKIVGRPEVGKVKGGESYSHNN